MKSDQAALFDRSTTALMPTWQERAVDRFYRQQQGWIDGSTQFHRLISCHVSPQGEVLDLGPGPESQTSRYLSIHSKAVDGLDVDVDAQTNPALRKVLIYREGCPWPCADESYDAVVSDYSLEHLSDPLAATSEAYRVLRPNGVFLFRTPNLCHYVSLVSRLTPHWFHVLIANRLRNNSANAHNPYPTWYRMNRPATIRKIMSRARFSELELTLIEKEPSYGMSSRLAFYLFMGYERLVNSASALAMFRATILGAFVKSASPTRVA